MFLLRALVLIAAAGLIAPPVSAQQSVDHASIGGRVLDPSGAVVADARVTVRHQSTNHTYETRTGGDGRYRFPYLRVGPYELVVESAGLAPTVERLVLRAGAAFELPVVLSIEGVTAGVTVTRPANILETARSQIAGTVAADEVGSLPLNGRNFLETALLVPGVAPTTIASTQLFPETSAVGGITLSINSQRNLSNNFIVDGLSANDDAAGLSGMTYGLDAIEQVQVVTSGGQAELGRALGGYVNVVTRSGTNSLRATAYDYIRDDSLNARNALSGTRLPMHQSQYGASVGGPVVADHTFYFANVEQRRLDQSGLTTIPPATVAAINDRLVATGYAGPLLETGVYRNPVDSTNVLAKIDHQLSGRDQLSVRYSLYDLTSQHSRGAGGLSAPSASQGLDNLDQAIAVGNTLTLSPRTVLESRAQISNGDLLAPPTDTIGPAVNIAGVASFGRLSTSPTGRRNAMWQVVNNLSHQAGAHALRIGADVLHNDDTITFPRSIGGAYAFPSLAAFLAGTYNNAGFSQTFGDTSVSQNNPNVAIYVQDEWKVSSDVTLNAGLRYELQLLETIDTDADNLAPRVGVTWSPFASRRTLVRAGAGLYHDRVPLRALANALLSAGNTTALANLRQVAVNLSPGQSAAPVFPAILPAPVPSVTLPGLTTMDRGIDNAYSRQAGAEIEQQLGAHTTIGVGYQYVRGLDLLMSINQNVPSCVPAGINNGCRPNASHANDNRYSSAGESVYHGLHVLLTGRPSARAHYRMSYTLSKSENNLGEFFFSSPIDPFDLAKDWGRSDNDQRHRLVVSGSVSTSHEPASTPWQRLGHGFELSAMIQAYSAPPFNITSGVTTIQGTAGRPVVGGELIPRNAGVGSAYFSLSARLARSFPIAGRLDLDLLVEGFNLTNHVNPVTRNTTFGAGAYPSEPAPGFGRITAVGEPRSFQLGVRLNF